MPIYHSFEDVRIRLIGKVRFSETGEDENKMPIALALRLMNEAEGEVEESLSPRYFAPFQTCEGAAFSQLPARPTREIIRTLCELQSVMKILETDFGMGGPADGSKYSEKLKKHYDTILSDRLLKIKEESYRTWAFPPLPGMKLNYMNAPGDDGFAGRVHNSSNALDSQNFPKDQINSPADTFWTIGNMNDVGF